MTLDSLGCFRSPHLDRILYREVMYGTGTVRTSTVVSKYFILNIIYVYHYVHHVIRSLDS